ncbi:dicarboxylate/amino acid:cation symporter [Flavobacterium columnare NBRC 100251 = ATCC 23463]|uniref:Proton glutamate symport protein GltP n=2 Tax=Flavobacterium columnare TaxID=996 RepID=G8XAB1_FLACA|nr:dicarboxylate/amino acid:cation symporter [Flavobacterium columnare]AEW85969.1 proton glutamate symport protein GltP [Flavobacterium columnare ATCC 49512]AMO19800.1 dicarboxylate/amino acid:cation symporter [Flavobacterium columnare]ANO48732.1 proton glutamate symport protein GltP [Flavobacterium columnare]APT23233.1 dicarboxylate/amino acid:cation symporter [Flavobacterium columnare]AUX17731.1 C4-dicarboxylate ABC transporter [Flavobacterium columnare]
MEITKNEVSKKSIFSNLTVQILLAMLLGAALGIFIHNTCDDTTAKDFSGYIKMFATVFIRLVQMIISPLVFTTLVVGIAKLGDIKAVGRIGGKALGWFFTASFISLLIGMFWVNILQPGAGLNLSGVDVTTAAEVTEKTQNFSAQNFVEHIIPKSVVEAMATNEILQIVIFSIFFGLAAASLGDHTKSVINALDKTSHIILKMVNYVMKFAPLGVFGAIAGVFAIRDLGELLLTYAKYFGSFLVGITSLWIVLLIIGYLFLGKRIKTLLNHIVSPLVIAFGTTSSEAVFPKLTEELEKFGIKDKIVSFMLPLGYSFNLDGSMMYMTFASIFIAQAYGVSLDLGTQLTMLLVLMLTSKGIAGVPRASLVVVAATCGMFDIPVEGIALILPIDHFCDMFRSATNVLGNALATSVVGNWEKE